MKKNQILPLDSIEVLDGELEMVLGGFAYGLNSGRGCNCGCASNSNPGGSGAGCNCDCSCSTTAAPASF